MISKFVFALFAIMMNTLQICKINTAEQTQEDIIPIARFRTS